MARIAVRCSAPSSKDVLLRASAILLNLHRQFNLCPLMSARKH